MRRTAFPALLALLCILASVATAVEPSERLPDQALEARARVISAELRCLVCQNESIDESHADLAHDIRILVRRRLTAGDSNQQVIDAVVDRYGAFVLLRPPVEPATYVLWFAPPALLLLGLGAAALWMSRRPRLDPSVTAALTDAERRKLDALMRENAP